MRRLTHEEWIAEAKERFGPDPRKWAFKCPACGTVSTCEDFQKLDADPQDAVTQCIGRVLPKTTGDEGLAHTGTHPKSGLEPGDGPCDWAAFGLLGTLDKGLMVLKDGLEHEVFDFAEPAF